jgi:nucleotide-binding universal stress UspA family protein
MFSHILLCTHGTPGAQLAESYVFDHMLSRSPESKITILSIIDKDWTEMSSDDWLNTSKARTQFKDFVEEQVTSEIQDDWNRLIKNFPQAESCKFMRVVGDIEETMVEVADKIDADVIVVGPYTKKKNRLLSLEMRPGLADTIDVKKIQPVLSIPLLIAPQK